MIARFDYDDNIDDGDDKAFCKVIVNVALFS